MKGKEGFAPANDEKNPKDHALKPSQMNKALGRSFGGRTLLHICM